MRRTVFLVLVAQVAIAAGPKFEKSKIQIGSKLITVEIADNEDKREYGLMYRHSLPKDEGMLFVFDDEKERFFWMKNTFVSLSIGFFDASKKLVSIVDMEKVESELVENPPTYASKKPARYALEMAKDWFKVNKIKPGVKFSYVENGKK